MSIKTEYIKQEYIKDICRLWNNNFSHKYQINEAMIYDKIVNDKDLFSEGTLVCREDDKIIGFAAAKISDNNLPEYQNTAWLSTIVIDKDYRRRGLASLLYNEAEKKLKQAGIKKVIIAGEMNNFFSGIPNPSIENKAFFSKMGYVLNTCEHYDLSADVSVIDFDKLPITVNQSEEFVTRPFTTQDIDALELFFDKEFPTRWKYEIMTYINNGGNHNHLLILCRGQEVKGFCKIFVSNNNDDAFSISLGSNWGGLGPIGIAEDIRGTGLGNRILCDSLKHLKGLGARNVNIDWTVLKDFYGQFGFTPWRTYLGAYKEI